ncbi:hypothetical protein ABBQ38_004844 [Trebouxia sp. C0009 RCD-2024]
MSPSSEGLQEAECAPEDDALREREGACLGADDESLDESSPDRVSRRTDRLTAILPDATSDVSS